MFWTTQPTPAKRGLRPVEGQLGGDERRRTFKLRDERAWRGVQVIHPRRLFPFLRRQTEKPAIAQATIMAEVAGSGIAVKFV